MRQFISWKVQLPVMVFVCASASAQAAPSSFAAYQQNENAAFAHYVTNEQQAFKAYQSAYQSAFADYKKGIERVWQVPQTTTAKSWVSYTPNFKQKTVVNFEKGTVTVSTVVAHKASIKAVEEAAYKRFEALSRLSYQQAYQEDRVAQQVDKLLQKKVAPSLLKIERPSSQRVPVVAKPITRNEVTVTQVQQRHQTVVVMTYRLKPQDVSYRIKTLLPSVIQQANKQHIDPALILAIVKNESAFNPLARSHIPAYGLMQIVPSSAGKDATAYLFGRPKLLSSAYLYSPENNLKIGAAYLHILNYRYLKSIKNPRSRMYCVISAYNTGAGNVAKSFTGSYSVYKAAIIINRKSPKTVYNHLQSHLPYNETKHYLTRVSNAYFDYLKYFKRNEQ